jgi:hypothetical protein
MSPHAQCPEKCLVSVLQKRQLILDPKFETTHVDVSSARCVGQLFNAYVVVVEGKFGLEAKELCGFEQ